MSSVIPLIALALMLAPAVLFIILVGECLGLFEKITEPVPLLVGAPIGIVAGPPGSATPYAPPPAPPGDLPRADESWCCRCLDRWSVSTQ